MKTEKILEKLYLMQALNNHARESFILEFIDELKAELLKDEAKKNGTTQAKKAADNILKQLEKTGLDCGAFMDAGRQIIGGAYSAVRLEEPLPVKELPKTAQKMEYNRFIDEAQKNSGAPLSVPSAEALSAFVRSEKAAHKGERGFRPLWDFGDGLPVVDAALLLEMLYLLPGAVCVASARGPLASLYFCSAAGDGLLCPCRRPQQ